MTSFFVTIFYQNHFGHPNRLKIHFRGCSWVKCQSFAFSDIDVYTIWMPRVILTKELSQNSWSSRTILIFKYSLVFRKVVTFSGSNLCEILKPWHCLIFYTISSTSCLNTTIWEKPKNWILLHCAKTTEGKMKHRKLCK